ncbi:hypothetical protein WICPIJ_005429 [Wickerhamomyces pijperi]|uniref:Large ribosomal subunit protein mL50 n=1 Tax=Wickerhamomyces pijperi TaxID=599730 RepID=A0A9P8Q3J2_WICPI|nr:hypothetical protein WICPIJ_005429 [Wickerhamomyces pijperi]
MMIIARQTRGQARLIHTSSKRLGFMDWFQHKKDQESKQKVEKAKDIKEVISDAENNRVELKKIEKIEFIGKIKPDYESKPIEERLQGFKIEHWLNKQKITDSSEFQTLLLQTYTDLTQTPVSSLTEVNLSDLKLRFDYTLAVQSKSGHLIPDFQLSKLSTGAELFQYFERYLKTGEIHNYNPHHLDLSKLEFTAPNITVQKPVNSKQRKTKFRALLKEARAEEASKVDQLIESARA